MPGLAHASRGRGRAHRVFHPLCGATPDTLLRLLLKGGVAPGRMHVVAVALAMTALRLPFTLAEAAACAVLPRSRAAYPAPIFVIGHWRSGTTHLTNVLSRSGAFAILSPIAVGLPAEALGLARLVAPFIGQFFPRTRLIDEIALSSDLPQEDELAMANLSTLSCNHGIYFPQRLTREFERGVFGDGVPADEQRHWAHRLERYVAKMTRAGGNRPLLIRNPANSARIPALRAIWPEARFLHIHRHPAEVYASSVRMFSTLVRELSLGAPEADVAGLVRQVYPQLMSDMARDSAALPAGVYAEIRHEDLCRDPLGELSRVHRELSLPGFEAAVGPMTDYLASVRYSPRTHAMDRSDADWLAHRCAPVFARWDYRVPEAGSVIGSVTTPRSIGKTCDDDRDPGREPGLADGSAGGSGPAGIRHQPAGRAAAAHRP